MSMMHTAYFIDWIRYTEGFLENTWPAPDSLDAWLTPLTRIRRELRTYGKDLPEWKADLLDYWMNTFREEIASEHTPENLATVRNLNFVAVLNCAIAPATDYEKAWDILKSGLATILPRETADTVALGYYWRGDAWKFEPELVSYQYGIVLADSVGPISKQLQGITPDLFASRLGHLDCSEIYPIFLPRITDADTVDWALRVLENAKHNFYEAQRQNCSLLYLLN